MTGTAGRQDDLDLHGRLKMFDPDGTLAADCREIWALIESDKESLARQFWIGYGRSPKLAEPIDEEKIGTLAQRILPYLEIKHVSLESPEWVAQAGEHVASATAANIPLTSIFAGSAALSAAVQQIIIARTADDPAKASRLAGAYVRMTLLQVDIYAAHYDRLCEIAEHERRSAQGAEFNKEIITVVESTAGGSRKVRAQAAEASQAARGMLGKTSEVAAAAEQSAVAMREAAQTAAGLIMAIEEARNEVEVAAGVATRAGEQAGKAVEVSQALSSHVEAIE